MIIKKTRFCGLIALICAGEFKNNSQIMTNVAMHKDLCVNVDKALFACRNLISKIINAYPIDPSNKRPIDEIIMRMEALDLDMANTHAKYIKIYNECVEIFQMFQIEKNKELTESLMESFNECKVSCDQIMGLLEQCGNLLSVIEI